MTLVPRKRIVPAVLALAGLAGLAGFGCEGPGIIAKNKTAFAYVTNTDDNTVSRYSVEGANQDITLLGTTPVGHSPRAITILQKLPTHEHFAYVANASDNTISQFHIELDGTLTPLNPPTVATGKTPSVLASESNGDGELVVLNQGDNTMTTYVPDDKGLLKVTNTISTGSIPTDVLDNGVDVIVLNVLDNKLKHFSSRLGVDPTKPVNIFDTGAAPVALAAHFSQVDDVYVANRDANTIMLFPGNTMGPGQLPASQTIGAPGGPISTVSTDLDLYASTNSGTILQYSIDRQSGKLSQIGQPLTFTPQPTVMGSIGGTVYLLKSKDNTIVEYLSGSDGTLTASRSVITGRNPTAFAMVDVAAEFSLKTTIK